MNEVPWILQHPFYKPTTMLGILCAEMFFSGVIIASVL